MATSPHYVAGVSGLRNCGSQGEWLYVDGRSDLGEVRPIGDVQETFLNLLCWSKVKCARNHT